MEKKRESKRQRQRANNNSYEIFKNSDKIPNCTLYSPRIIFEDVMLSDPDMGDCSNDTLIIRHTNLFIEQLHTPKEMAKDLIHSSWVMVCV